MIRNEFMHDIRRIRFKLRRKDTTFKEKGPHTLGGGAQRLALFHCLIAVQLNNMIVNTVLREMLVAVRCTPQPLGTAIRISWLL